MSSLTHPDGRFELTAVPHEVIRAFSTRRASIEKALESSFVNDALAAERVALNTRPNKKVDDRAELNAIWQKQAQQLDFDVAKVLTKDSPLVNQGQNRDRENNYCTNETSELAIDAVHYGAAKLANREAVFTTEQLIAEAMVHSLGAIRLPEVLRATETLSTAGVLLPTRLGEIPAWTTKRALFLEKAVLSIMHIGKDSVKAMYDRRDIDTSLKAMSFTPGQHAAAVAILSSTDRIMGIQGYAGTGKTFMLNTVREYAEKSGYTVRGFAPSATAAHELQQSAQIESKTLASHLLTNKSMLETQNKRQADFSHQVWVVDESSMTSTQDMFDILKLSELTGARVVLVGDTKQLGAVEAGKPFQLLQKAGMQTVVMKDILRQSTTQALQAVLSSIDGKIRQAIGILGNQVNEVENREDRLNAIATHYLTLKPQDRKDTIVLAPANDDRHELNALIRNGLRNEGIVHGEEQQVPIFVKLGFTPIEKSRASNYTPGMVVRFTKDYRSLGVTKDTHALVQHIYKATGIVALKTLDEKIIDWNPAKLGAGRRGGVEVYSMETRELAAGDTIRWTSNNKELGVYNSELADVVHVSANGIQVRCNGKDELTLLKPENPTHRHFEYAYTSTVYAAQGKTSVGIIMNGEHFRRFLTNTKTFYTGLSRAKENMHVYVSDKNKYINTVQKNLGEKTSALESLLDFRDKKPEREKTLPEKTIDSEKSEKENRANNPGGKKNRLKELVNRNREKSLDLQR